MKIAVSGKGGSGKTTISANLAKLYINMGFNVYAVDADPDGNLGLALGIRRERLDAVKPIFDMREFIDDVDGDGALYLINPDLSNASDVSDVADRFSLDIDNLRFLRIANLKTGGSSCYCKENTFLKTVINSLYLGENDVAILDMSGGTEHLARGTAQGVDLMLIAVEPSRSSVDTARNIEKLSLELGVKDIKFIGNKTKTRKEEMFIKTSFPKDKLIGVINYSEQIAERAMGLVDEGFELDNLQIESVLFRI